MTFSLIFAWRENLRSHCSSLAGFSAQSSFHVFSVCETCSQLFFLLKFLLMKRNSYAALYVNFVQIRSHAQKYFLKVQKNRTGEHVPPPRPKRKSAQPYPQKASKCGTVLDTYSFDDGTFRYSCKSDIRRCLFYSIR